ncbi:MAG: carboxy-S-adenosyl-L-methionine synthase CmoA [Bdellovibrionota bacterium]
MDLPVAKQPIQLKGEQDRLFADGPYPKPFEFNDEVVKVFDDMVSRSVPLYEEVNRSIAQWTYLSFQPGSNFYDIGCSTGTTIELVSRFLPPGTRFVGIDLSPAMLEKAQEKLKQAMRKHSIDLYCQSALDCDINNASVVVMAYTLQFIPVADRPTLLKKIYAGLKPGGILYLCEKLRGACAEFHEIETRIYENFKLNAGYSKTEIERKKEALDNVLVPLTLDEQVKIIKDVGFYACEPVMKWNNFASIIAIKK